MCIMHLRKECDFRAEEPAFCLRTWRTSLTLCSWTMVTRMRSFRGCTLLWTLLISLWGSSAFMSLARASSTRHPLMQATVEALSEFDAEQAAAVRGVLGLHIKEYRVLARSQGLPEDMPKRTLMRLWVKKLLVDEVRWQYDAFCQVRASLWSQYHKRNQVKLASHAYTPLARLLAKRWRGAQMHAFPQ